MNERTLQQKVVADIEKAGFRSEMATLAAMRAAGWSASGLASYVDLDSEISREFDVEGHFHSQSKEGDQVLLQFFYALCVEVKKSDKPWVVFSEQPKYDFYLSEGLNAPCFLAGMDASSKRAVIDPMDEHSLGRRLGWIGTGIHESFKAPDQPSRWYQALVTACKAAEHKAKANSWSGKDKDDHYPYSYFAKPVVVLDGTLFRAYLGDSESVEVEEIPYASVRFSFSTAKYSRGAYIVDIVRLGSIGDYLEIAASRGKGMFDSLLARIKG